MKTGSRARYCTAPGVCPCQLAGGGPVKWSDMVRLFDILRAGGAGGGEDPRCRADGFVCTALGGRKDRRGRVQVRAKARGGRPLQREANAYPASQQSGRS